MLGRSEVENTSWGIPKVFVVIPIHNRKEETLKCLRSLGSQSYSNLEMIVVDDGSVDGSFDAITEAFPFVRLIRGSGDLWWAGATNVGVRAALVNANDNDFVLTLNNDLTVGADYVSQLVRCAKSQTEPAIVGSTAVDSADPSHVLFCGIKKNWVTGTTGAVDCNRPLNGNAFESDMLPGRGTLIPVTAFKKVGFFDDEVFPQYLADYDFSIRALNEGYRLIVSHDAVVRSDASKTGMGSKLTNPSIAQTIRSFWTIRSANHLGKRWRFALRHCPRTLLIANLICDTAIVVTSVLRGRLMRALKGEGA